MTSICVTESQQSQRMLDQHHNWQDAQAKAEANMARPFTQAIKAGDHTVKPVSVDELRSAIESQRAIAVRPKGEKEEGASTSAKKPGKPKEPKPEAAEEAKE